MTDATERARSRAQVAAIAARTRQVRTPFPGGEMTWRLWGSGPPLILLHGGHGSWSHWIRTIPALAQDHLVLAPDMPGYGDSDSPPDPYSPPSLAAILAQGLDWILGAGGAPAIVGFSFGAVVGGYLALQFGRRVRRFVMIGAGGLALPSPQRADMRSWRYLESVEAREAAHRENLAILMIADPARIDDLAVFLQSENARRTRINSRQFADRGVLTEILGEIDAPLAGLWGSRDATAAGFVKERETLLRRFDPQAEFAVIEGAGHWVQYEAPDAVNEALLAILGTGRRREG